jgi:prepilin-type N-terminal cleavage/methylation domain-containing protein
MLQIREKGVRVTAVPMKKNPKQHRGFTLIEVLVVIAIIGVLAALAMYVFNSGEKKAIIQQAQSEREQLVTAIDSYHARYGFYPPSNGAGNPPPLYYELIGTTTNATGAGTSFTTLDNASTVNAGTVQGTFGVGAFMNCTKGSGEDSTAAQTFLPGLKPGQIAGNGTVYVIVTAATSDPGYLPMPGFTSLSGHPANPWRYACPGSNNPASYDLWTQLSLGGKTYLICNWVKSVQVQ